MYFLNSKETFFGIRAAMLACLLMGYGVVSNAQFSALSPDPMFEAYTNFLGQGMSLMDFNQDGWDDLTITKSTGEISFYEGGPNGLTPVELGITSGTGRPTSVMWLDIDNDGDRDFLHTASMGYSSLSGGGLISKSQVWINEAGVFEDRTTEWGFDILENRSCSGMAFHDLNQDRDLDLMISVYALPCEELWETENVLFEHSGESFTDISTASGIANGFQPSFQGVWMDLNGDALLDLFVINDAGVELDCDYVNFAYINNGDGTFTEDAASLGLNVAMSSMSVTVGDPDGDGAEEVFVTNQSVTLNYPYDQETGAYFDPNGSGGYEENSVDVGLDTDRWSWGAMWIDFDSDGWEDLVVSTSEFIVSGIPAGSEYYDNYFFKNPGNLASGGQFIDSTCDWNGCDLRLYNVVRGDLDGDLRPDVVGLGLGQFASFWVNESEADHPDRHALTVSVCGSHSNNEAIGTRMVLHADGHAQHRTLRAGQDLYVQHSATQFFGMGTAAVADSLELFWPTGAREVWYNLSAENAYQFVEGQSDLGITFGNSLPGDSVTLILTSPPNWTGLTYNGESIEGLEIAVPLYASSEFQWSWLNGLFSLTLDVDWSGFNPEVEGCTYANADNYNPGANLDDGSCTFYANLCGAGTVWSVELQQCVVAAVSCPEDIDGSGVVGVDDILSILSMFGQECPAPE